MIFNSIPEAFMKACRTNYSDKLRYAGHGPERYNTDMPLQDFTNAGKCIINLGRILTVLIYLLLVFTYSAVSFAATEPSPAAVPTVTPPTITNYFDLTVNYTKPADADGVLVVGWQAKPPNPPDPVTPPFDGTVYTANSTMSAGDSTILDCILWCDYVVADATSDGSVTVTGLKEGFSYFFAAYSYNGSGIDINYNRTINATVGVTTATVPLEGTSHNELWVAAASPKDGTAGGAMTSADCVTACHATHHSSQNLPRIQAQMDVCTTCHNGTDATDNMGLHAADTVDCNSCHSIHSWKTEELYSTDPDSNKAFNLSFIRKNMSRYINPAMYPPPLGGGSTTALDNTVFQDRTTDFAFKDDAAVTSYNGVCQSCHTTAAHHTQGSSDNHHVDPVTGVNDLCTSCHNHKDGFAASGHSAPFGTTAECTACHTGADVVDDIHTADCTICHVDPAGGDYTTKSCDISNGCDGDATLANGTAAGGTWSSVNCLTCHPKATYPPPEVHHISKNNYAVNGNCTQCHIDPRVVQGYPIINQMSCRACHVQLNGTTVEIMAITPGKERAAGTGLDTGNTFTAITTANGFTTNHTIPNSNAAGVNDAIQNYGACFDCHGATGRVNYSTAPKPLPYHALPLPGAYNASLNTIGGDGWQGNLTATPNVTYFRGNQNWDGQANNSYWPVGKGRLNVGYAQHSLAKGATNTVYKVTNNTAGGVYQNFITGLRFGKQVVHHQAGTPAAYVPHFDSTYTGNDVVTITSGPTEITDKGKILGWTITANSTNGHNLHIIWGGRDLGTISSGSTYTVSYRDASTEPVDKYFCLDQFNSYNTSQVVIVSEDGGYAIAAGVPLRGSGTGETPSSPQTCTYK